MKMKSMLCKSFALVLTLAMILTMFSACGSNNNTGAAAMTVEAETVISGTVTIEADGQQITIEDTEGKNVQMLLDEAGITLNDGDVISIAPDQILTGDMTIQLLRKCTVVVVVAAEDPLANIKYTAVLVGGTVSDAIEAVGVNLADNQIANYELDKALEDGMEIIISTKEEEPEVSETSEADDDSSSSSRSNSSSRPNSNSSSRPNSNSSSSSRPSSNSSSRPSSNSSSGSSSRPSSNSSSSSESGRTIVSVETYEDCDGSGHGVKVITYSDGTQEEVSF